MATLPSDTESWAPICRICFDGDSEGELVSPCKCEGSQKHVHLSCLRRWQRSVQLGRSNHAGHEERHLRCGVCKATFDIPPQDRTSMMSDLACVRPEELAPGLLLISKRTSAESAMPPGAELNILLRAYIEAKAAHFREAVYLVTDVRETPGSADSDTVIGVNIARSLGPPDVSVLEAGIDEAGIVGFLRRGVEVRWMNGGPSKPCRVTALVAIEHLAPLISAAVCRAHGLRQVITEGGHAVLAGPLPGVLEAAANEAERARPGAGQAVPVVALAGHAEWSRAQLLSEMARGSWGWCQASSVDVQSALDRALEPPQPASRRSASAASQSSGATLLGQGGATGPWGALRHSGRVSWAPENELSQDFERPQSAAAQRDPHADAVEAFVQQFEVLRRGGEPRQGMASQMRTRARGSQSSSASAAAAARGHPCVHQ